MICFLWLKVLFQRKFTVSLLKSMIKVQRTTGNAVDFSTNTGLTFITRNEVGARLYSRIIWNKSECKNAVKLPIHNSWITRNICLAGQNLRRDQEKKTLCGAGRKLGYDLFGEGVQQLVPGYDKCLNLHGDYVENHFSVGTKGCNKDIF